MSNENLSLQEVASIVEEINYELGEFFWDKGYCLSVKTNGFEIYVGLGDLYLWGSEDDPRGYIYDEEAEEPLITTEGYEMKESLRKYLIDELKVVGSKLLGLELK